MFDQGSLLSTTLEISTSSFSLPRHIPKPHITSNRNSLTIRYSPSLAACNWFPRRLLSWHPILQRRIMTRELFCIEPIWICGPTFRCVRSLIVLVLLGIRLQSPLFVIGVGGRGEPIICGAGVGWDCCTLVATRWVNIQALCDSRRIRFR